MFQEIYLLNLKKYQLKLFIKYYILILHVANERRIKMTQIIIGNIIALIASLLMVYTGLLRKKEKFIYIQTFQMLLLAISNLVLGGITGIITNSIAIYKLYSSMHKLKAS